MPAQGLSAEGVTGDARLDAVAIEIVRAVATSSSIGGFLDAVAPGMHAACGFASITVFAPTRLFMRVVAVSQPEAHYVDVGASIPRTGLEPTTTAYRTGEPVWIDSRDEFGLRFAAVLRLLQRQGLPAVSMACVPAVRDGRTALVVGAIAGEEGVFDPPTRRLMRLFAESACARWELDARGVGASSEGSASGGGVADASHVAVLTCLAGGIERERVAETLGITDEAVDEIVGDWLLILAVGTIAELVERAEQLGVLAEDP